MLPVRAVVVCLQVSMSTRVCWNVDDRGVCAHSENGMSRAVFKVGVQ